MKMMHDYEGEEDPEYPREVPKLNLMIEWRTQIRWQPADMSDYLSDNLAEVAEDDDDKSAETSLTCLQLKQQPSPLRRKLTSGG